MKILAFILILLLCSCTGNHKWKSNFSSQQNFKPNGIWTVVGNGKFNGVNLIKMEHGFIEETGEYWAMDTYGLLIKKGHEKLYLLWTNSPLNPYGLQKGDRFRFTQSIQQAYFEKDIPGYRARENDIVILPR